MHEGHFTDEIVKAILTALKKHPGYRPETISVSVGEMLHLVPESVETHFKSLVQNTPLQNTHLELKEIPVEIKCRECQKVIGVEDHHFLVCTLCGSFDVEIISGNEVKIDTIKLEELPDNVSKVTLIDHK